MKSILVLYLQTKNEKITKETLDLKLSYDCLYYLRPINDNIKNENIFIYYDIFFNFNTIKNVINNYEFIVYLDDNWKIYNIDNLIKKSLSILTNNIDQVIFNNIENKFKYRRLKTKNLRFPNSNILEYDNYNIFNSITNNNNIFIDKNNPFPENYIININYTDYLNHKFNILNFRLLPSCIRTKNLIWNDLFLKNDYFEYKYSELLQKNNFISCYTTTKVDKIKNKTILCNNKDGNNITIVTAFLDLNLNRPSKRPSQLYDYIEKSKGTLSIDQNMVIYLSKNLISQVEEYRKKLGFENKTKIIEINEKDHLYLYNKLNIIEENVKKNVPPYNIPKYILAVNSRYNLIKDAIINNYFSNDYYAWIDFSAGHIVDIPEDFKITYSNEHKIRIAWIGRAIKDKTNFEYNHKCCGGGVFVGHKIIMLELIKLHDIEFQNLMKLGYCINDDKLLFLIFEKYPQLFNMYICGYRSLLTKI